MKFFDNLLGMKVKMTLYFGGLFVINPKKINCKYLAPKSFFVLGCLFSKEFRKSVIKGIIPQP